VVRGAARGVSHADGRGDSSDDERRANDIKQRVAQFREKVPKMDLPANATRARRRHMLTSTVFKDLDKIAQLDLVKRLQLKILKVVVLGTEGHGKSTLPGAHRRLPRACAAQQ